VRREIPDIGKVERVGWVSVSNGRSMDQVGGSSRVTGGVPSRINKVLKSKLVAQPILLQRELIVVG
jgi:hypothetical protein